MAKSKKPNPFVQMLQEQQGGVAPAKKGAPAKPVKKPIKKGM